MGEEQRGAERRRSSSRGGGTHSYSVDVDWHACRPSARSSSSLFLLLSHTQLAFLSQPLHHHHHPPPPASQLASANHTSPPPHAAPRKHAHLSRQSGWREAGRVGWGGWGGAGGRGGLSLEECCLYLKTHISHMAKNKSLTTSSTTPPPLKPLTTLSDIFF